MISFFKVRDGGDPFPPSPADFNFSWHGGPYFEIQIFDLSIDTERGPKAGCQYFLHFIEVYITTSTATSLLGSFPKITSEAENTSLNEVKISRYKGEIQMGIRGSLPHLTIAASRSGGCGTSEVRNGSTIVVNHKVRGSPADGRTMRWVYEADDYIKTRMGLTVLPAPLVKLGFDDMRPHVEIEVRTYWSMTGPFGQRSEPRRRPSKNKKGASSFTNLIQQATVSLPMENLRGGCWTSDTMPHLETKAPLRDCHVQAQKKYEQQVKSKNDDVELKVNFGCTLYGENPKIDHQDSDMIGVYQKHFRRQRQVRTEQFL
jgi:hypothetical protein